MTRPSGDDQFAGHVRFDVADERVGTGLPTLLAACGDDDDGGAVGGGTGSTTTTEAQAAEEARAIVGDVTDFALTSDEWAGAFGFVTMPRADGLPGVPDTDGTVFTVNCPVPVLAPSTFQA